MRGEGAQAGDRHLISFSGEVAGGNRVIPKQICGEAKPQVTSRRYPAPGLLTPVPTAGL